MILWSLVLGGVVALAGDADERAREFAALDGQVHPLFAEKSYEKAAELCRRMVEIAPEQPGPRYNLACALARLGKAQEALAALEMAAIEGFNQPDHMQRDDDLASVRSDPRFERCVAKARENEGRNEGPYEAGANLSGVKTVEGDPEGGLRYRLRMSPAATAEKPDRLIVWLHPAGGSANQQVEAMAPRLIQAGFALLVPTQKDWRFWSPADVTRLFNKTLPEVAKTPGLDAVRPVLMGYSAGGQAALLVWHENPGKIGGLVLDAAYPLRQTPKGIEALPLPANPAIQQTPVFVLVGEKDGGSQMWRKLEPAWRQAGVPLTVHYIPDKGHAWLFGPEQLTALEGWLKQLKAGKPEP